MVFIFLFCCPSNTEGTPILLNWTICPPSNWLHDVYFKRRTSCQNTAAEQQSEIQRSNSTCFLFQSFMQMWHADKANLCYFLCRPTCGADISFLNSLSCTFRPCWSCWCVARVRLAQASWSPYLSIHCTLLRWPNWAPCRSTIILMRKNAGVWTLASCSAPWMRPGTTAIPEPCASSILETPLVKFPSLFLVKVTTRCLVVVSISHIMSSCSALWIIKLCQF